MTDVGRLLSAIEPEAAVALVSELVRIPSVNWGPAGEQLGGEYEKPCAAFVAEYLGSVGLAPELQEVEDGRCNVIARWPGAGPRTLVLDAHMDTVPAEGMSGDPFSGEVRDGKLFGRGAADTKATLGAMMCAVGLLAQHGVTPPATIILTATVDEESRFSGARKLQESGLVADGAIVGEPTELALVAAAKGAARWQVRTKGHGVHTCHPEKGHNAIYDMARVIAALEERYIPTLAEQSHPLVGSPRLTVSMIRGGRRVNVVPDECLIDLDRRVLPGETEDEVVSDVTRFIDGLRGEIPGLDWDIPDAPLFLAASDALPEDEVYRSMQAAIADTLGQCEVTGVAYSTHSSVFEMMGIPSVTFGAGSIDQAHTSEEWVEVEQIGPAVEILVRACLAFGAG